MSAKSFYVTFGDEFRTEPHPHWVSAHPDGYCTIVADSERQGRAVAYGWFGPQYSTLLESRPRADVFPLGELRRVDVSSSGVQAVTR